MKRRLLVLTILAALVFGVTSPTLASSVSAAPAGSHAAAVHTHSHPAVFNRTKFVLHLAVAAFLIHYIYKKYKEHKLGRFHIFTDIKAAAAGLIAYHELKVAYGIAKSSNRSTGESFDKNFWVNTVRPYVRSVYEQFTRQFLQGAWGAETVVLSVGEVGCPLS